MSDSTQENSAPQTPLAEMEHAASLPPKKEVKKSILGQTTSIGLVYDPMLATTNDKVADDDVDTNVRPTEAPNVTLEFEYTSPELPVEKNPDFTDSQETLFFFAERGQHVDQRIQRYAGNSIFATPAGRNWNSMLRAAGSMTAYGDQRMDAAAKRPGSEWMQYLKTEAGRFGFNVPRVAEEGVGMYRGVDAMLRVRSIMGLGGVVSVPLFHSGFWITLAAPSESALIELFRRISDDKVALGRQSIGLVFSNEQSYLSSWLIDFCLEHMRETSLKTEDHSVIRSLMKAQDQQILLWALACLIWPRGFNYGRALTTKEGIQNTDTVTARINVAKLLWVDNNFMTANQKKHMARRTRGSVTEEQVQEYQKEFSLSEGRLMKINDQLSLRLKQPTLSEYVEDGELWISNIVRMVDTTFTQATPGDDERNRMIDLHAKAARLRKYGSWIKAIVFTDPAGATSVDNDEPAVLEGTLEMLSALPEAEQIEKAIGAFIDDTTMALIAIPETSGRDTGIPRYPHLIPLDVVNTFFTLLAQKIGIIDRK
jgi:hypothetical protein